MASPGQGFVGNAHAALSRPLGEFAQLRRGKLDIRQRQRRGVRAHQHQAHAEGRHQVELALGAVEVAPVLRVGHALEIAEWLEQFDDQPALVTHRAQILGGAREMGEVGLEEFDAVEACCGDGVDFLRQRAAQRNGGDGSAHVG